MKYAIVLALVILSSCSYKPSPNTTLLCLTLLGPFQFNLKESGAKYKHGRYYIESDGSSVGIPEAACLEVIEN